MADEKKRTVGKLPALFSSPNRPLGAKTRIKDNTHAIEPDKVLPPLEGEVEFYEASRTQPYAGLLNAIFQRLDRMIGAQDMQTATLRDLRDKLGQNIADVKRGHVVHIKLGDRILRASIEQMREYFAYWKAGGMAVKEVPEALNNRPHKVGEGGARLFKRK